jgi:hypothetical protein
MPFTDDTFAHLFDWEKDPQRQEKIVNARLEAEFDGIATGLSAVAADLTTLEGTAVTAPNAFGADNRLIKSAGTGRISEATGITCDDSNNISGVGTFTASGLITASAGQIAFPATQNPSGNANTLDDYEEGSFTPVLTCATPGNLNVAYFERSGNYTKVGNCVTTNWHIITSTFTHTTASGDIQVAGFPFSCPGFGIGSVGYGGFTSAGFIQIIGSINGTTSIFRKSGSAQAFQASAITDWPSGGTVFMRCGQFYQTT